jgi:GNAT superfamily N-acetyltransferase
MELQRDGYEISTDRDRLDLEAIWGFLRTAYWSLNVPREVVERSIERSLVFGLYTPEGEQAGFARAVTDGVTFAWIADVFVLDRHRGRGLGVWLVETVLTHPEIRDVRSVILGTLDAHSLYERFGFRPIDPEQYMQMRPSRRAQGEP